MEKLTPDFSSLGTGILRRPSKPPLDHIPYDWLKLVVLLLLIPFMFLTFFVVGAVLFFLPSLFMDPPVSYLVGCVTFFGSLGLLSLTQKKFRARQKAQQGVLKNFANHNGWKYGRLEFEQQNAQQKIAAYRGAAEGDIVYEGIHGDFQGRPFELTIGWHERGSTQIDTYEPSFSLTIPGKLPEATFLPVLDPRNTDPPEFIARFMTSYANPQKVSMEGDFDNYFRMYIPQDSQVAALSFVAPDVMQTIKEYVQTFCIKFSGEGITLTAYDETLSRELLEGFFTAASKLLREVR